MSGFYFYFFNKRHCWVCTVICGSALLAFKGTMKVKQFVLIKLMLTLNGLQPAESRREPKKKKILSQSNDRLNLKSYRRDRKRSCGIHSGERLERFKNILKRSFLNFSLLEDQKKSSVSFARLLFDVGARRGCRPFMSHSSAVKCRSSERELQYYYSTDRHLVQAHRQFASSEVHGCTRGNTGPATVEGIRLCFRGQTPIKQSLSPKRSIIILLSVNNPDQSCSFRAIN